MSYTTPEPARERRPVTRHTQKKSAGAGGGRGLECDIGTFEWDFVTADLSGQKVRTAGCDLLQFVGDKVAVKNAFREQRE
jgi:hypothetical protein